MSISPVIRPLLTLGRLVAFPAAASIVALMAWWGYELLRYAFFSEDPTWREVGFVPLVVALRIFVAGWVVWGVVKPDGRPLPSVLLSAGACSFLILYGWYFMLLGPAGELVSFDNLPYLVAVGDLLILAAGLAVGCACRRPVRGAKTTTLDDRALHLPGMKAGG